MSHVRMLAFGIAKEIVGASEITIDAQDIDTVAALRKALMARYPQFAQLRQVALAVNGQYTIDSDLILSGDEVAIIPPVSGG